MTTIYVNGKKVKKEDLSKIEIKSEETSKILISKVSIIDSKKNK
jgi:hypothetical protein